VKLTVVDTEHNAKEEKNIPINGCARYDCKKQEGRCNKAYEDCIAHMLIKKLREISITCHYPMGNFSVLVKLKYDWPIGLEGMQRVRAAGEKDELIRVLFALEKGTLGFLFFIIYLNKTIFT
jgi:hypothetical protein